MSKWAGFAVGLIIAITIVLSVVRPFEAPPEIPAPVVADSPAAPVKDNGLPEVPEATEVAEVKEAVNSAPGITDPRLNAPIPDFQWDQAQSAPPASEVTPLPEPNIRVVQPVQPGAVQALQDQPPVPDRQWFAFWQPFTSELSAKGFAARLERITGLDYRIVKVDFGQYHVAFGYDDDASREQNLAAIEAATGLNLRGGRL